MQMGKPSNEPPSAFLFTRKEAAKELRISIAQLDRAIAAGELKAKKHGRSTFILRSEIERFVKQLPELTPPRGKGR